MTTNRHLDPPSSDQQATMAPSRETHQDAPGVALPGRHLIVRAPGEIDITNVSQLTALLAQAFADGAAVVIADATATTFCDCDAVSALIDAHRRAAADGSQLRVAAGPAVRRLIGLTETHHVLDVYPTLAAALTAQPAA
jgi:anti-anti-sigma factor